MQGRARFVRDLQRLSMPLSIAIHQAVYETSIQNLLVHIWQGEHSMLLETTSLHKK